MFSSGTIYVNRIWGSKFMCSAHHVELEVTFTLFNHHVLPILISSVLIT